MKALTIITDRFFLRTGIYSGKIADFVISGDTIASYDQSEDFYVGNTPV
jgi:hypothetical protein